MNVLKSVSLNALISLFFLIGIFCLPLNSDPPIVMKLLGEYRNESAGMFFLISFILLFCRDIIRGKLAFPYKKLPYLIFIIFILYLILSFILNYSDIKDFNFKNTSGTVRYIKQMISLILISVVFFYVFYNVALIKGAKKTFFAIRKVMWYSLILVSSHVILEILILYFNMRFLTPIAEFYDFFPFTDGDVDFMTRRLLGLTFEPPAFGTYLITIAGFMFTYIFTGKGVKRFIPFGMVVVFGIISGSRAAFVIILAQVILAVGFAYITIPRFRYWTNRVAIVVVLLTVTILLFKGESVYEIIENKLADLNFFDQSYDNTLSISNKSRLGIQYANLQVFLNNPMTGVGWGQQAYSAIHYFPSWSKYQNWEFTYKYLNQNHAPFPPGYNLYVRLLAETGLVGTLLFLSFLVLFSFQLMRDIYRAGPQEKYIYLGLLIVLVGALINWFQTDTVRQYGFWLCLAIYMVLKKSDRQIIHED